MDDIADKNTIKKDMVEAIKENASKKMAFSVYCADVLIGMYVLSKNVNLDYYVSHFCVQVIINIFYLTFLRIIYYSKSIQKTIMGVCFMLFSIHFLVNAPDLFLKRFFVYAIKHAFILKFYIVHLLIFVKRHIVALNYQKFLMNCI